MDVAHAGTVNLLDCLEIRRSCPETTPFSGGDWIAGRAAIRPERE
jgi:hypothetical protein